MIDDVPDRSNKLASSSPIGSTRNYVAHDFRIGFAIKDATLEFVSPGSSVEKYILSDIGA